MTRSYGIHFKGILNLPMTGAVLFLLLHHCIVHLCWQWLLLQRWYFSPKV